MANSTYIEMLLNYIDNNKFKLAYEIQTQARSEFDRIYTQIHLKNRNDIGYVDEFIRAVEGRQEKSAAAKRSGARIAFDSHIRPFLEEEQRSQRKGSSNKYNDHKPTSQREDVGQPGHQSNHTIQSNNNASPNKGLDMNTRVSEQASRSLRANNPNIADLSDANRPTKTAERFSELYDNQWTDAFEELNKRFANDKEVVDVLLKIAQWAYVDCIKESKSQINMLADCAVQIVKYGKVIPSKESENSNLKTDKNWLVQYRKEIASGALTRMKENFENKHSKALKQYGPKTKQFADRCVELTWWMCVQDPPIYMDDGKDTRLHRPDFYKPYTQSGTKIDFIVWPALLLHDGGAVLAKGVAQYIKK